MSSLCSWVFLSKDGRDQYINLFARGSGAPVVSTQDFVYEHSRAPIVLRGILKHKIMQQCWQDHRDFYYMDSGYLGNRPCAANPQGWKLWHRIVKNNLQHGDIVPRDSTRLARLEFVMPRRRWGSKIILAVPDEKPCKFYGIDRTQWTQQVLDTLKQHTDRPVVVRQRNPSRDHRIHQDPLQSVLKDDVHALITFNSNAAVEAVMEGVPVFVLAPSHAAAPVANLDLKTIENPHWPGDDIIHTWACHLSYGQFHVDELRDGTALGILNEN